MRFFIDTANIEEIEEINEWGVLSGVTTNPSLIAKEGKEFEPTVRRICELVDGPVSLEVVGMTADVMVEEARVLAKISDNVVVKVPMTAEGLKATNKLSDDGIMTNVTLVFSPNQAILAATVGATFVSPFVGRLDDIGHDGMEITAQIQDIIDTYGFETEVIAASIRHPEHVVRAAGIGIDVATVPYSVLKQMLRHPLTDSGIERFLADWEKVKALTPGGDKA